VVECVVGYTGGKAPNPTYRNIKDHTEALKVEFDPKRVSYQDLLREWSRMHHPNYPAKVQYRSAMWYLDEPVHQRTYAEQAVNEMRMAHPGEKLHTRVKPAGKFYRAEEYHQNFLAKRL
jgi:peptide-methionine (S)-S-oxide reductase